MLRKCVRIWCLILHHCLTEASISARTWGPDPTTFEPCWVHSITGPDQVFSRNLLMSVARPRVGLGGFEPTHFLPGPLLRLLQIRWEFFIGGWGYTPIPLILVAIAKPLMCAFIWYCRHCAVYCKINCSVLTFITCVLNCTLNDG